MHKLNHNRILEYLHFFFNSVDPVSSHTSTTTPMDTDEPHGEKWDGSGGVLVQSSRLCSV